MVERDKGRQKPQHYVAVVVSFIGQPLDHIVDINPPVHAEGQHREYHHARGVFRQQLVVYGAFDNRFFVDKFVVLFNSFFVLQLLFKLGVVLRISRQHRLDVEARLSLEVVLNDRNG